MKLTREEMDRRIDEHFRFEANDDVDGVLRTLAEDVEHDVVGSPLGPIHGREAARQFYLGLFADLSEGRVESQRRLYGEDFVIDDSIWQGRAIGRPFGIEGNGRPLAFRLLHVIEFADNGEIRRENAWIDVASIQRQLQQ